MDAEDQEQAELVGDQDGRLAYRPAELADSVGLSAKAVYRAISRGELRAARVANGTRLLIPVECAREWLQGERLGPEPLPSLPIYGGRRPARESRPLRSALASLK